MDVQKCVGLDAKDSNGLSDPYVVIYLSADKKSTKKKTKTVFKTLSPSFNEQFVYEINNKDAMLIDSLMVEVWDYGMLSKDGFIGCVKVPLETALKCVKKSLPSFQNATNNLDLMCVLHPETAGAGCKTRFESRVCK